MSVVVVDVVSEAGVFVALGTSVYVSEVGIGIVVFSTAAVDVVSAYGPVVVSWAFADVGLGTSASVASGAPAGVGSDVSVLV